MVTQISLFQIFLTVPVIIIKNIEKINKKNNMIILNSQNDQFVGIQIPF